MSNVITEITALLKKKCQCGECKKERQKIGHKINVGRKRKCNCKSCLAWFNVCPFEKDRRWKKMELPTGGFINIKIPGYYLTNRGD